MRLMYFRFVKSFAEAIDKRRPGVGYNLRYALPDEPFVEDGEPHS